MKAVFCLFLVIAATGWQRVESFSSGAPNSACTTLSPNPTSHGAQPQTSQVPYSIDLSPLTSSGQTTYTPGQTYTLTLSGGTFKGLLIQTRIMADGSPGVGTFTVTDSTNTRLSSCTPSNAGITHSNSNDKTSVSFQWTAPPQGTGAVRFRFAVVQVRTTYWADQSSALIQEQVMNPADSTTMATGDVTTAMGGMTDSMANATTMANDDATTQPVSTMPPGDDRTMANDDATTQPVSTMPPGDDRTMATTAGAVKHSNASAQDCILTTSVAAIVCSFILFFGGAIAGSLVGHLLTVYRQRNRTINQDLAAPPFYEELPYQTTNPINPRNKSQIELETNAAYELPDKTMKATPSSVPRIELETNAAYGHVKN